MRTRIKRAELDALAAQLGYTVQHDCGGFRIVDGGRYLFPDGGICPTAPARDCMIYLSGIKHERDTTQANGPDHWIR